MLMSLSTLSYPTQCRYVNKIEYGGGGVGDLFIYTLILVSRAEFSKI